MEEKELIPAIDLRESADFIRERLQSIETRNKRNLEDAVHIGLRLHQVKESLAHGQFGTWLMAEFGMSRTSATRYMQVGAYFADKLSTVDNLPSLSIAFLLAQVSTPDNVRLAVLSGDIPADMPTIRHAIEVEQARPAQLPPPATDKEDIYAGMPEETVEKLEAIAERIKARLKELASAWLTVGATLNKMKARTSLERVFNLAWMEYHMQKSHASELMLYAESYGSTPIDEIPWETVTTIAELATDHLMSRDEDIALMHHANK